MTLAFAYIDQVAQAGMHSRPSRAYCARAGSTPESRRDGFQTCHYPWRRGGFETRLYHSTAHRRRSVYTCAKTPQSTHHVRRRKQTLTLPSTDSDRMDQAGIGSTPHHPHRVGTGSTSDRTHPVGAGFRPDIARGVVEAGLKPASTTTPHTAEDRLHLCENATIHTPRGAGK